MSSRTSLSDFKKFSLIIVLLLIALCVEYFVFIKNDGEGISIESQNNTSQWLVKDDTAKKIKFKYPSRLPTTYISVVDWPPQVNVYPEPLVCNEAGTETARAGQTVKVEINGRTYCRTIVSEGAAGSIYNQYAYGVGVQGKILIYTFTTRSPQCGNYSDFQKTDCENEKRTFNLDRLVDQIVRTTEIY